MNKLNIIQNKYNKLFNTNNNIVLVNNKTTNELTNIKYKIKYFNIVDLYKLPIEEEYIERNYILKQTKKVSKHILEDKHSRRACFVNNYDTQDNHCLSYFHYYIRNNQLHSNIYVRSQNFDTNFIPDNQTFLLAYTYMYFILLKKYVNLNIGYINVHIFSLHRYIDE